jgi:glycosyltransferase involved in cell wall biosynthesis
MDAKSGWHPATKLLEIDLERPFEAPEVPARYQRVRFLVKLAGAPLGNMDVPNYTPDLQPEAVRGRALEQFAARIWEDVLTRRWTENGHDESEASSLELISVVVCTRDRPEELRVCLEALARQTYPRHEIVVVDNAPKGTATHELAGQFDVRYVVEPTPGLDWARNRGIAEARGSIVAYTDDDARPDPDWLSAIAAAFRGTGVDALGGLVVAAEIETIGQWLFEDAYGGMAKGFRPRLQSRGDHGMSAVASQFGAGCNLAFRKDALVELGGFDPALDVGTVSGGGGDLDMLQRMIDSGRTVLYEPRAIVRHVHRRGQKKLLKQMLDNGRGYSASLAACWRRMGGRDRLRVVREAWRFLRFWVIPRFFRRLFRRGEQMPLRQIAAEAALMPFGPFLYRRARRQAERLAAAKTREIA